MSDFKYLSGPQRHQCSGGDLLFFVSRDGQGAITEVHPEPTETATEAMPADHPEVHHFIFERSRRGEMEALDLDFIRVIEDMIEVLIEKRLILFSDLPPKVQEKLLQRKQARQKFEVAQQLIGGEDDTIPL